MTSFLARLIIHLSALLAPRADRARLREEWLGELRVVAGRGSGAALKFAIGAPKDAWSMRQRRDWDFGRDVGLDCRDAVRSLRSTPVQSATVILCLALGSSLTVLMFTIVNGLIAGELPGVRERAQLVTLHAAHSAGERRHSVPMYVNEFRGLPTRTDRFTAIAGEHVNGAAINAGDGSINAGVNFVSGNYFDMLGGTPAAGRLLQQQDDQPSGDAVAVVSYDFWQAHLGGRFDAIGGNLRVARSTYTIVGVAPRHFFGLSSDALGAAAPRAAAWIPLARVTPRADRRIRTIARLRDRESAASAESGSQHLVLAMNDRIGRAQVASIRVEPLHLTQLTGALEIAGFTTAFMSIPLVVLAIACANVAGVQLSRSVARTHELAIRVSLGASRARVTRFLLVETFLTAAIAGVLACIATPALVTLASPYLAFVPLVDANVVVFSMALPLLVTLIAGLGPARRATGFDVLSGLRLGARAGRTASPLLRRAVLVTQTALSVGLLIFALVLARGLQRLPSVVGPVVPDVVAAEVMFQPSGLIASQWAPTGTEIERQLRSLPGVRDVAVGGWRWYSGSQAACWADSEQPAAGDWSLRGAKLITANYFDVMRVAPIRGRLITDNDRGVVVNEAFMDAHAARNLNLGSLIRVRSGDASQTSIAAPIVGIVPDAYERYPRGKREPLCYLPYRTGQAQGWLTFFVQTSDPGAVSNEFRTILARVDSRLAVRAMGGIDALVNEGFKTEWSMSRILGVISVAALVLAAVGLFGAMSHATSQRRHEFGVRLALGARVGPLMISVAREAGAIVLTGAIAGAVIVLPLQAWLRVRFLPTMTIVDPLVFGVVTAALLLVAFVAAWTPARRISAINPVSALKAE